ncbi:MAG: S41 family peptidase [Armatimonadetes bacterium]|nr:S41 family peptidase [Armatimonadota bacterium]
MRKLRLETIIPIAFLLLAAFFFGFLSPDVIANSKTPKNLISSLELLPQRLESALTPVQSGDENQPLPLLDTYSSVMNRLKSDYYGKPIDERKLTYNAIRGTLVALGDPFTRFLDPEEYKRMREENEGNFIGIGALLEMSKNNEVFVKEPLPDTPAMKAGVKSNDVILAVDRKVIKDMELENVVKLIRGPEGTKVRLTLRRAGKPKPFDILIVRRRVEYQMVTWKMLDDKNKIGYVRLYQFNEKSDLQLDLALNALDKKNMKGLVFDLRGNPGGLLNIAVEIGSRFLDSGPVVIIQERGGQKSPLYVVEEKHNHKRYPLVVLVDKMSASASEIVSGAIKDTHKGTLVGTVTFGKGRVQTIMPMQDGSAVAITTAKYLTPNGTDIHKKGISPDVTIEANDNFDPNNPATDVQLIKGVQVLKVKMGLLPKSVLDKAKKTAEAKP